MKWLQMIDERAADFGYVSRHMAVRTYLIVRDLEELAIDSEIHDTKIDLDAMIGFFSNLHNREAVRGQGELETHWESIMAIAEGEDIWSSDRTIGLREYSESHILPLASSGHRVEAMVRECSLVSDTARGEANRSHLILQRSVLASKINDIAAKSREGRVLHANASIGSGIQGERVVRSEEAIRKHGGVAEDKGKVRMRARGAIRVVAALEVIKSRYVEVANKSDADRKEVKALLETKSADVRITAKVEKFIEDLDKPRRENRRQKESGVDKTYRVADRIPFKRTKAALHTAQLRCELQARSLEFDAAIGYKNICVMLKEFEGNKSCFKPMTEFFKQMMQDETIDDD